MTDVIIDHTSDKNLPGEPESTVQISVDQNGTRISITLPISGTLLPESELVAETEKAVRQLGQTLISADVILPSARIRSSHPEKS